MTAAAVPPATGLPGLSRRQFLVALGVAGATAVVAAAPGLDWAKVTDLSEMLVAPTFRPLLGQAFRFGVPGADPVALRLETIDGIADRPATDRAFTLRFSGPAAATQGGEVGMLRARGLPPLPLLVVPSGRAVNGRQDWTVTVINGGRHE